MSARYFWTSGSLSTQAGRGAAGWVSGQERARGAGGRAGARRRASHSQLNAAAKSSSIGLSPIRGGWKVVHLSYRVSETVATALGEAASLWEKRATPVVSEVTESDGD